VQQDPDTNGDRKDGTAEQTDNEETAREIRVRRIVDALPPLTEEQKDVLALIFGARHKK
jgi:hypothetical protein